MTQDLQDFEYLNESNTALRAVPKSEETKQTIFLNP